MIRRNLFSNDIFSDDKLQDLEYSLELYPSRRDRNTKCNILKRARYRFSRIAICPSVRIAINLRQSRRWLTPAFRPKINFID